MIGAPIIAAIMLMQAAPAAPPQVAPAAQAPASSTVSPVEVQGERSLSKRRDVNLDAVTCHDELPPGTRFKIKVCATNREFRERTRDQQELVREWQSTPITTKQ